jgi:hypothetical protein
MLYSSPQQPVAQCCTSTVLDRFIFFLITGTIVQCVGVKFTIFVYVVTIK